jgi:CRISPR-associated protein Csb2
LELSIVDVRRSRRTVPVESVWTTYARNSGEGVPTQERSQPVRLVQAIRLAVVTKAPLRATRGVLLADEFHRRVTRRLDGGRPEFLGHSGATTNHQHAHWVPIPRGFSRGEPIDALLVWVPGGLTNEEVAAVIGVQKVSGHRGDADNGYDLKGLPEVMLLLEAAGSVEQVAPELCGPARSWRSLTPYLPVRHRKRETMADYLTADVSRELSYRGLPSATTVEAVSPQDGPTDRWAIEFRRYRVLERLKDSRRGLGLRLRFATSVAGPLLLGQLSHFGFGIFVPDRETGP